MTINGVTRGFQSPPYANGPLVLNPLTLDDLVLHVITVGRATLDDVFAGGTDRSIEIEGLDLLTRAYVTTAPNGQLRPTSLFHRLDGSERSGFSYRVGMAIAKAAAEQHLGTRWMRHLKPLLDAGIAQPVAGATVRPDLAGYDESGDWHLIEAKGWWKGMSAADRAAAKAQATQGVATINGVPPGTWSYCFARLREQSMFFEFVDPPAARRENENDPGRLLLKESDYLREYYSLFIALADADVPFSEVVATGAPGDRYVVADLSRGRMLGLRKEMFELAKARRSTGFSGQDAVRALSARMAGRGRTPEARLLSTSRDGYALLLGTPV